MPPRRVHRIRGCNLPELEFWDFSVSSLGLQLGRLSSAFSFLFLFLVSCGGVGRGLGGGGERGETLTSMTMRLLTFASVVLLILVCSRGGWGGGMGGGC